MLNEVFEIRLQGSDLSNVRCQTRLKATYNRGLSFNSRVKPFHLLFITLEIVEISSSSWKSSVESKEYCNLKSTPTFTNIDKIIGECLPRNT
jgi:hypothetical protein